MQYSVEKFALPWENVKVPNLPQSDSSFNNWIAPRDHVKFFVPLDYLKDDLQIFVQFNYEWEMNKQGFFNNTPEHRINYRRLNFSNVEKSPCSTSGKELTNKKE